MLSASSSTKTLTAERSSTRDLTTICSDPESALYFSYVETPSTHINDGTGRSNDDLLLELGHSPLDRIPSGMEALHGGVLSHPLNDRDNLKGELARWSDADGLW